MRDPARGVDADRWAAAQERPTIDLTPDERDHLLRSVPLPIFTAMERIYRFAEHSWRVEDREAVDRLFTYVAKLRAELAEYQQRVTTGGPPAPITKHWEGVDLEPPPSANDPTAPPLESGHSSRPRPTGKDNTR